MFNDVKIGYISFKWPNKPQRKEKMEESKLKPFVKEGLDILFVPLNPANGSDDNGHYFSVNQAFWNQLLASGLITENVDKLYADDEIFGKNEKNYKGWFYGITDLVPNIVNSNGKDINPSDDDCKYLKEKIKKNAPKVVVFLHSKVKKSFLAYMGVKFDKNKYGKIGRIIENCSTMFYVVPFPIDSHHDKETKIGYYKAIKGYLDRFPQKD